MLHFIVDICKWRHICISHYPFLHGRHVLESWMKKQLYIYIYSTKSTKEMVRGEGEIENEEAKRKMYVEIVLPWLLIQRTVRWLISTILYPSFFPSFLFLSFRIAFRSLNSDPHSHNLLSVTLSSFCSFFPSEKWSWRGVKRTRMNIMYHLCIHCTLSI